MFLKQHLLSDYCAVYATGMALSLIGSQVNKQQALTLFNAKSGWPGASHAQMSAAVKQVHPNFKGRWFTHHWGKSSDAIDFLLRRVYGKGPILVTAYCIHRSRQLICGHAFVIEGAEIDSIRILDPLGRTPKPCQRHNAIIRKHQPKSTTLVHVDGASWDICLANGISLLRLPL